MSPPSTGFGENSWVAQPGSQVLFLSSPIFETLYEGTRGPGKTDALLMDFAQHVGQGWGSAWRGVLFRETYKQLSDVVAKTKRWFQFIFPGATFREDAMTWTFPGGEQLLLRHMRRKEDYWNYHGHAYPWIGWEELTNWANPDCYLLMMSCCRSTVKDMPRKYRATCNPYGKGHNWVKRRFRLPQMRGRVITEKGRRDRVAIHGHISENRILLDADPDYIDNIRGSASNPAQVEAWLSGSWDITSGGLLDDLWDAQQHVVTPFRIPRSWRVDRSFDWGSSKPFSVGWWAESDGSDVELSNGRILKTVRGDLFRIGEWYGIATDPATGEAQENVGLRMLARDIAEGIKTREVRMGLAGRVKPGPADSAIYTETNGNSVAVDMEKAGVHFTPSEKGPGSRVNGWMALRQRLSNALSKGRGEPREGPGIFVFATCEHFIRTVPPIPRDENNPDDADTDAEDHIADDVRYRVFQRKRAAGGGRMS